jgi:hypothetical protein
MARPQLSQLVYDEYRGKLETDPMPDEIARRAAEIRAAWDAEEELRRRERPQVPWEVPTAYRPGAGVTSVSRVCFPE